MPGWADSWGVSAEERAREFPCDRYLAEADGALFRGVDVDAPPGVVYRWLCQLRVAPYSYDWIDNWGRRSPRELTSGLEELEVGQRFMTIFDLVEFERDRHVTLVLRRASRLFGEVAVSYVVVPVGEGSRLIGKFLFTNPGPWPERRLRALLAPPLDLVMARKQLLNLKRLAESQAPVTQS